MTREQAREAAQVLLAFADGKEIECKLKSSASWSTPVLHQEQVFYWNVLDYRIKPTATLRPWTADEVPLGAWMRRQADPKFRWLILNVGNDDMRMDFYLKNEHSTDKGVTWLPCGVMEEAK
jgi:hypothetical protein